MYSSHEPGTSRSAGARPSPSCAPWPSPRPGAAHSGCSSSPTLRVRLMLASPSTRSITMAGLPSSSPVGSTSGAPASAPGRTRGASTGRTTPSLIRVDDGLARRRVVADDVAAAAGRVLDEHLRHRPAVAAGDHLVLDDLEAARIVRAALEEPSTRRCALPCRPWTPKTRSPTVRLLSAAGHRGESTARGRARKRLAARRQDEVGAGSANASSVRRTRTATRPRSARSDRGTRRCTPDRRSARGPRPRPTGRRAGS